MRWLAAAACCCSGGGNWQREGARRWPARIFVTGEATGPAAPWSAVHGDKAAVAAHRPADPRVASPPVAVAFECLAAFWHDVVLVHPQGLIDANIIGGGFVEFILKDFSKEMVE